jgi:hypothetical protein
MPGLMQVQKAALKQPQLRDLGVVGKERESSDEANAAPAARHTTRTRQAR